MSMSTNSKEYYWVLVVSLLILALSSAPILTGYAAQTSEQRFIGTFYDRQDYAVHLAMMHYGEQSNWHYQLRFTTEPHNSVYIRTFYVVLGHIGSWFGIPASLLFQVARLGFGLLALFAIYRLMIRIFSSTGERRLAFVLAAIGAGLGWLQMPLGLTPDPNISPFDMWHIDAYILMGISLFPHFSATIAALVLAVTAFIDHLHKPSWQNIAIIAASAIFVQIVNPIAFILADIAMAGAFVFISWKNRKVDGQILLTLGLLAIIQIPLFVYSLILLTRDPAWAVFTRQNATLSPPPLYLLFGFGLFWPFVIFGVLKAIRNKDERLGWAVFWTFFAFSLAYLPFAIQRRFLLAVTIPLAVLATSSLVDFSAWLGNRLHLGKFTGAWLVAAFTALSPLILLAAYSTNITLRPGILFEPVALVAAVDWLGENSAPDDVVLATEPTAQLVAIRTPLRLFFGHEMETLHYREKSQMVEQFYRGGRPADWLAAEGVDWVVFGPHEKEWGQVSLNLPVAFQNDQVVIYKVMP
jgi:hypothetical protein